MNKETKSVTNIRLTRDLQMRLRKLVAEVQMNEFKLMGRRTTTISSLVEDVLSRYLDGLEPGAQYMSAAALGVGAVKVDTDLKPQLVDLAAPGLGSHFAGADHASEADVDAAVTILVNTATGQVEQIMDISELDQSEKPRWADQPGLMNKSRADAPVVSAASAFDIEEDEDE